MVKGFSGITQITARGNGQHMGTDRRHGQNISGETACAAGVIAIECHSAWMRHFRSLAFVGERDGMIHGRLYFESFYATL